MHSVKINFHERPIAIPLLTFFTAKNIYTLSCMIQNILSHVMRDAPNIFVSPHLAPRKTKPNITSCFQSQYFFYPVVFQQNTFSVTPNLTVICSLPVLQCAPMCDVASTDLQNFIHLYVYKFVGNFHIFTIKTCVVIFLFLFSNTLNDGTTLHPTNFCSTNFQS